MGNEGNGVIANARAYVYVLLQGIFGNYPSDSMLDVVCSDDTKAILEIFTHDDVEKYSEALGALERFACEYQCHRDVLLEKIGNEYTTLLIGPDHLIAPPWESVYVSKDPLLFQPSTLLVREAYLKEGMLPAEYPHVADDHVSLELGFLAHLVKKCEEARERGNMKKEQELLDAQVAFLDEHLLVWVEGFSERMKNARTSYFYPNMTCLLVAFLKIDRLLLSEVCEERC